MVFKLRKLSKQFLSNFFSCVHFLLFLIDNLWSFLICFHHILVRSFVLGLFRFNNCDSLGLRFDSFNFFRANFLIFLSILAVELNGLMMSVSICWL
jgi:hypothetical protein